GLPGQRNRPAGLAQSCLIAPARRPRPPCRRPARSAYQEKAGCVQPRPARRRAAGAPERFWRARQVAARREYARKDTPSCRRWAMRRVVVTGLGVVAPNGIGKEAFWSACVEGRSGVGPIRTFDASAHPVKIAAEVPDFDLSPFVPAQHRNTTKIMGRAARFAVAAAGLAV